ncbi:unnamed protein product [Notodromas monacha]|uniref:Uncharacterized protein n=1 Tax=Notodromas monacha TaxID=399045 RepID=A0A7R9G9I4_9CRUS|nr:unnamed protein product [Notodromas monacha]CAG0914301.1 unnamed protein product [Notodromas monacha]
MVSSEQLDIKKLQSDMLSTSVILRLRWSKRFRESVYLSLVPFNPEQDALAKLPSEPCIKEVGKTWVSLTWSRPEQDGAPPITAYKVEAKPMGEENWKEVGLSANIQYDAFNLNPEKEYIFRVTPRNKYGWGEPVTTSTPIQLLGPSRPRLPEFVRILPGHFRALAGYALKLKCQVKGTAEISWYHENTKLEPEAGKGRVRTEINMDNVHTLIITDITRAERGMYMCAAENAAGRVTTYCHVTVVNDASEVDIDPWMDPGYPRILRTVNEKLRSPEFTMRLRTRRIEVSYPVRLTCHVDGNPLPSVNWFKDAELIEAGGRYKLLQEGGFHTLEVTNARYEDAGLFSVRAMNTHGATTCHASLIVDDGLHAYVSPKFLVDLEDVSVVEGSSLVVEAAIEAYPAAGVTCLRDGQRLRLSRRHCLTLDRTGHLSFSVRNVRPSDEGKYSFIVSNVMGKTMRSVRVFVTPRLPSEEAAEIEG